ncbi:hypothetical protein OHA25_57090 [Nonomuraea sp. NBC_00507]|uniref:hypothetical protein n=1 Tax=Nonomuraea sp. NBC_00507 TaxID=2976002 RepID=UPI002E195E55
MNLVTTWTKLHESHSSTDLVLCVDFTETGRIEAGFPDLVKRLAYDATYWHVAPPAVAPDSGIGGAAYVRSWLEPVKESGMTVRAVMGYCVGAVYAAELVDALAELQDAPPELIVFDPEPTSLENVYFQFDKVFSVLSTILSAEDIALTRETMDRVAEEEGITVEQYASRLFHTFRDVGHNAFIRAGLDQEYAEEMWATFSAFLSYLTYADLIDPWDGWRRGTALSSSNPNNGLNRLRAGTDAVLVAKELCFEEGHDELLRSDEVARAVTELLER